MELLENNSSLCYIKLADLLNWLRKNNLSKKNFYVFQQEWEYNKNIYSPFFFSDTELLVIHNDTILLKTDENSARFLAETYILDYQKFCRKVFNENKQIILLTNQQWEILEKYEEKYENDELTKKCIILFKNKESIEKSLIKWFEKLEENQ